MTTMTLAPDTNAPCGLDGVGRGSHFPEASALDARLPGGTTVYPLTIEQAEDLMDRDGNITVTVLLEQSAYFERSINAAQGIEPGQEDYAHSVAFGFGQPLECSISVIGTEGEHFIVSYSTHIREFLDA